jgi:hypothetical protein
MGWLSGVLRGGTDEISWDDLIRRIVDRAVALRRWGARGETALPEAIEIALGVPENSVEVVRGFTRDERFDREVGAMFANRIDRAVDELPLRDYRVDQAEKLVVDVREAAPRAWEVAISGGDLDGRALPLTASEVVFGRGSGTGDGPRSDVVVCEQTAFVSRRAGRLIRTGHRVEVTALDQGDLLLVRRASGELVRPARTARGRVALAAGDIIELSDGRAEVVKLVVRRVGG